MAAGGPGSGARQPQRLHCNKSRRSGRVMKPASWPRYMREKRLKDGRAAYYWEPQGRDLSAGFSLHREALGTEYGAAVERAGQLNAHLNPFGPATAAAAGASTSGPNLGPSLGYSSATLGRPPMSGFPSARALSTCAVWRG